MIANCHGAGTGIFNRRKIAAGPHWNLPPVRGDRVHLQQVLLNLVLNGTDALGEVRPRPAAWWCVPGRRMPGPLRWRSPTRVTDH